MFSVAEFHRYTSQSTCVGDCSCTQLETGNRQVVQMLRGTYASFSAVCSSVAAQTDKITQSFNILSLSKQDKEQSGTQQPSEPSTISVPCMLMVSCPLNVRRGQSSCKIMEPGVGLISPQQPEQKRSDRGSSCRNGAEQQFLLQKLK